MDRCKVNLLWGLSVQCRVRSDLVVESLISTQMISIIGGAPVGSQIHLLVFHRPRKSLNEHVVPPASLAVHADFDFVFLQHPDEVETRKLTALVRIHNFRDTVFGDGLLERGDAELGMHRVRRPVSRAALQD